VDSLSCSPCWSRRRSRRPTVAAAVLSPCPQATRSARGVLAGTFTNERLALVLSDEVLASRLCCPGMLAVHSPVPHRPKWDLAPLIPAVRYVFASGTFPARDPRRNCCEMNTPGPPPGRN
jgi:hypothetical protein